VAAHCSSIDPFTQAGCSLFSESERETREIKNGKANNKAGCYYIRLETRLERVTQLSSHTGTLSSSAPPGTCLILPYISSLPARSCKLEEEAKRAAGLWKGRSIHGNQRRRTRQVEKHTSTRDRAAQSSRESPGLNLTTISPRLLARPRAINPGKSAESRPARGETRRAVKTEERKAST
jgi:hypothetical protein